MVNSKGPAQMPGPLKVEMAMTTANAAARGSSAEPPRQSTSARASRALMIHLADIAARPDTDPCSVCEESLPAYVLGDLEKIDVSWVDQHTQHCNYCRRELSRFEHLEQLLDTAAELGSAAAVTLPPLPKLVAVRTAEYGTFDSPIGRLFVAVSDAGVCEIGFGWIESEATFRARLQQRGFRPVAKQERIEAIAAELQEYFSGKRNQFNLPVDLAGITPFAQAVLNATTSVPFGQTRTYGEIAREIGKPGASRAVGNALNKNPVPLVVPCHRILPTGKGIGNYAGGVETKQRLLTLEGALPAFGSAAMAR